MAQVGQRAAVGFAAFLEFRGWDQQGCDHAGRNQEHAHDDGRRDQQFAGVPDASSTVSPLINGMTATPVSKPDSPSASFGNSTSEMPQHCERIAVLREQRLLPFADQVRMAQHFGHSRRR